MSASPLHVLKLGGSVLQESADLRRAVHEIYAHARRGRRVLAVVSALHGVTDRLLGEARELADDPPAAPLAALLATGEAASVAKLSIALDAAGIGSEALDARAAGLAARGKALDATLTGCDVEAIERALARSRVVILPGFVAHAPDGSLVLLGRGGSDLTALFLGARMGASRVRLIKDVDGLYERDPAAGGPRPRRFAAITWDEARRLGGRVVQDKALELARREDLEFEIGSLASLGGTRVGRGPTLLVDAPPAAPPLRVALIGHGSVGGGVARALREARGVLECTSILVRDRCRHAEDSSVRELLVEREDELFERPADVLVELAGGIEPARRWVERALAGGRHVVTANKALLAEHGETLAACARRHGRRLLHSAAVGGALPVLEAVRRLARRGVHELEAVLNATSSVVLDAMSRGTDRRAAVAEARARGLAEADPALDLDGTDVAHKLFCLARASFPDTVSFTWRRRAGIEALDERAPAAARSRGALVRLVGTLRLASDGRVELCVEPRELSRSDELAVPGTWNAARIRCADGTEEIVRGRGAGRWPTTEAVLADLYDLARWRARPAGLREGRTPCASTR